uniref:NADH-ubiquinone oxidoreductase chain 3 n=1 Tax=Limnoria quadripunctata TaxID=161573 RepID=A0A023IWP7_LIMQU|nr:NADH dehydrogenase subunit 3 [Limnoria quadripunctata]
MIMLLNMGVLMFLLSYLIMLASLMLGKKLNMNRSFSSSFECGFDPSGPGRLHFSVRFFLITLVFLIFDAEIILLLPLVVVDSKSLIVIWIWNSLMFISILLIGVIFEITEGMLDWSF